MGERLTAEAARALHPGPWTVDEVMAHVRAAALQGERSVVYGVLQSRRELTAVVCEEMESYGYDIRPDGDYVRIAW